MKKIFLTLLITLFSSSIFASDEKPGRFFEDQPDVEEYSTHTIYLLTKDGKDKEWDVNGKIEKLTFKVNKMFEKLTAKNKKSNNKGQTFKLDLTKDGKLDITFLRLDVTKKELADMKWEGQRKIYSYIAEKGFNNPKKLMFNPEYLARQENALEVAAFSRYPKLKRIKSFLENLKNPLFVRMAGSGSVIIAYYQSKKDCELAKVQFKRKFENYWCNTSKTL